MKNVISAIPTPNLRHPPVIGHLPVSMATKSKWPPLPPLPSRVYNRVPGLQHPERQYHLLRHHVSRLKKRKSSLHFFKTHLHFRFRLNKFLFFHVFVGFFSVTLYYFLLILILIVLCGAGRRQVRLFRIDFFIGHLKISALFSSLLPCVRGCFENIIDSYIMR